MNQKILIAIIAVLAIFIIYLLATDSCKKEKEQSLDIDAILKDINLSDSNNNNNNNMNSSNQTPSNQEEQIKKEVFQEGSGKVAQNGNKITVHYVGALLDGTKFDSSVDRGEPFSFVLGQGMVIQGWEVGLVGSKVGEKLRLTIPSQFAYGEAGTPGGPIPPNTDLIFEIEVLGIE